MSLTVTRTRMVDSGAKDRYLKPILKPVTSRFVAHVFAPVVTNDVTGVDTVISSDGGTLYFRAPNTADALPNDRWTVRGTEYESEGVETVWNNIAGDPVGTVVVVKRTEPTRG
ncbi:hypothetical protein ATY41_10710 [Leifsonia xyli subsp. xyli]|uniref:Uncharacterized protein n=2 Tax=Leifsonia xyli subsp. xyli TaxID=59736 RepID=Q6AGV3_LEIXX|nr:hypothetical protein [Leifsonia xyli]AAT88392.1 hypothetical protein Lxx03860 [Leifsonia xyli subsp. xyli str. CTCB07]ODA90224.1 hypothetical protein ATY41_10710 [Leifsonia xyli subsp. xyli]